MQEQLAAAIQWLALGQQVVAGGEALWKELKGVLTSHGIDADNAALDRVIVDAARRKAQAEADAAGRNGIVTGSLGD